MVLQGAELLDSSWEMECKFIGTDCEGLAETLGNLLNRRKKKVHFCGEDPCTASDEDLGLHVQGAKWWKMVNFPQGYLKAWGRSVLGEYIKGEKEGVAAKDVVTRKPRGVEGIPVDPLTPTPKVVVAPAAKKEAKGVARDGRGKGRGGLRRKTREDKPRREKNTEKRPSGQGGKGEKPLQDGNGSEPEMTTEEDVAEEKRRQAVKTEKAGEPEGLRRRMRQLTERLLTGKEPFIPEVVEIRSESEEALETPGLSHAPGRLKLSTGTNLDPKTSQLAVYEERKPMDIRDGDSKPKKKRMRTGGGVKKAASTGSALVAAAEWQQRHVKKEKEKKKEKKGSRERRAKDLVNLLLGEKGKKRKGGRGRDGMDPPEGSSDEGSSSSKESSDESSEMMGPLKKRSHRRLGAVLRMLVRHVRETLGQSAVVGVDSEEGVTGGVKLAS